MDAPSTQEQSVPKPKIVMQYDEYQNIAHSITQWMSRQAERERSVWSVTPEAQALDPTRRIERWHQVYRGIAETAVVNWWLDQQEVDSTEKLQMATRKVKLLSVCDGVCDGVMVCV